MHSPIVFLSGFGLGFTEKERCTELWERLNMTVQIFKERSRPHHKRGFSVVVSGGIVYPGWKYPVSKIMRQWLLEQGISDKCILMDDSSRSDEASAWCLWRNHLRRLGKGNAHVLIVSQSLHAKIIQQMLAIASNGECHGVIRACKHPNWRTFVMGAWHFLLQKMKIMEMEVTARQRE